KRRSSASRSTPPIHWTARRASAAWKPASSSTPWSSAARPSTSFGSAPIRSRRSSRRGAFFIVVDLTARDLLASVSSSAPAPGGGSASALASAVGTSLLLMVANLPKTRTNSDEDRTRLAAAAAALAPLAEQLTDAIDADAAAYDAVVAAYKLPKSSPDEQQARTTAIQRALRAATDVPLGVMRLSAKALEQ